MLAVQRFLGSVGTSPGSTSDDKLSQLRRFRHTVHVLVGGSGGGSRKLSERTPGPDGCSANDERAAEEASAVLPRTPSWANLPREKRRTQSSSWADLPNGIAWKVFQLLDGPDAAAARQVCFEWCVQLSNSRTALRPSWSCPVTPGWTLAFSGLVSLDLGAIGGGEVRNPGLRPLCFGLGQELSGLPCLRTLRMPALCTNRELVESAAGLSRLTSLDLTGCTLVTDDGMIGFLRYGPRATLVVLKVDHCRVSDRSIEAVATMCTSLTCLSFASCGYVTDRSIKALLKGPRLRELNMGGCRGVSDAGLKKLASPSSCIAKLTVSGCAQITDAGLPNLRSLTALDASFCRGVTGKCLSRLLKRTTFSAPQLLSLNLSSCPSFSNAEACLLQEFTALRSLQLGGCHRLSSDGLSVLGSLPALTDLNLSDCTCVGDEGAVHLSKCQRLESLSLTGCNRLTDAGLCRAAQSLANLKHLYLGGCRRLTDVGIMAVSTSPMQLTRLNLTGCRGVTDVGILSLCAHQPKLQSLVLRGCFQLTDASILALERHPNLGSLRMKGCPNVSTRTVDALKIDVCHAG